MKHEIQDRQRERLRGLFPAEESRLMREEMMKDDKLARFLNSRSAPLPQNVPECLKRYQPHTGGDLNSRQVVAADFR